jgi:hypothetical protein
VLSIHCMAMSLSPGVLSAAAPPSMYTLYDRPVTLPVLLIRLIRGVGRKGYVRVREGACMCVRVRVRVRVALMSHSETPTCVPASSKPTS